MVKTDGRGGGLVLVLPWIFVLGSAKVTGSQLKLSSLEPLAPGLLWTNRASFVNVLIVITLNEDYKWMKWERKGISPGVK